MSIVIFISCNGTGCDTILPVGAEDVISARIEARRKGWDTTRHYESRAPEGKWVTSDQCPAHRVAKGSNSSSEITRRFTADECVLGKACPARHAATPELRDLFHWCGHDQLGHRMANVLIRDGYNRVGDVTAASEDALLDLRGFGRMCLERVQAFKAEDSRA